MSPSKMLLSLLLVALSVVDASPLVRRGGSEATLGFERRINAPDMLSVVQKDRARAQAMHQAGRIGKRSESVGITNNAASYTAQVGVGSPPTYYTLLIDTGSSNTFIGTGKAYAKTSTSQDTGNSISVTYGSGKFSGEEWTDTVTLSSQLVISEQSIGVASTSSGFAGVDGILGVGPVDLTQGTVNNTNTVPTVMDNLLSQGTIFDEVLGVYYTPDSAGQGTGGLTFGGYDKNAVTGPMSYVSLTSVEPACYYWGIEGSITYDGNTILSSTAGIVDTGTTLILIASDAFQEYQSQTGGTLDSNTGLLTITAARYGDLKSLTFGVGGKSYELTPNGQIWPRSLNTALGGSSGSIYLVVSDIGYKSGSGLDFIVGYVFLERYYSVFDVTNQQIGFASTKYTLSTAN